MHHPGRAERSVPIVDDVDINALHADPYPIYRRLRSDAPIAWVSAARINLVTRFDAIKHIDAHPEIFPAFDPTSLMIRAMGHGFLRMDGPEHRAERMLVQKSVTADLIRHHWLPRFQAIVDELIDTISARGRADLFSDFAAPMASRCLMELLGLTNVRWQDLCIWSQSLMDAVGNYADDPQVWERGEKASAGIDAALDELISARRASPDPSMISHMANERSMPLEKIRANVKFIIGGGLNEPRDATLTAVYALLSEPQQLAEVLHEGTLWSAVFEETIRYCAPIGMYPRTVLHDTEIDGISLQKGIRLGLSVASACHDEKYWENPERFDIHRPRRVHLAFGSGPHLCLGARTARMQVGQLSVPALFERLPGLSFDPDRPSKFGGWVFRGPTTLPVVWNIAGVQSASRD